MTNEFIPWDFGQQDYQIPETTIGAWNAKLTQQLIEGVMEPGFKPESKDFYWFILLNIIVKGFHPEGIHEDNSKRGSVSLDDLKAYVVGTYHRDYSHKVFELLPPVRDIQEIFGLVDNAGEATSAEMMGITSQTFLEKSKQESTENSTVTKDTISWNDLLK